MALVIGDRVQETTTTNGTGTIDLAGAVSGFQTFVTGVGTGNTTYYCIVSGTSWEVGIGTVTDANPDTLSRTTILSSSNSGSAITLAGTSTVFGDAPAALLSNAGLFGPILSKPIPTSTNTGFTTWVNQGGATIADGTTGIVMTSASNGGSSNVRLRTKSSPSTPYTITALLASTPAAFDQFTSTLIGWTDGTKIQNIEISGRTSSPSPLLFVKSYSSVTAFNTTYFVGSVASIGWMAWFQLADDGTNVSWRWSTDGANYQTYYTIAKSSGYLANYDTVCWGTDAYGTGLKIVLMSYMQT